MSSFDGEFNRMVKARRGGASGRGARNRSSLIWNWLDTKQFLEH